MGKERGQGTVTRYRGRFRARVSVVGKRVSVGTFDLEADAWGAIAEFWKLHAAEVTKTPGLLTLTDWGRDYLDARETDGVHRSVQRDRSVWRARIDASPLGAEYVDTITPREVRSWVKDQLKTPSERTGKPPAKQTVVNALNLLRVALEEAVEAGHIEINPARNVRVPKIATDKETWDWLREEEIARLFACRELDAEQRRIFAVAIFGGLRQGELWGLRWADVDLKRARMRVARSYEQPTKGGRVRWVPLLAPALEALRAQPRICALVFPTADQQMRHAGDDASWHAARELAGVRRVRFHDLRHTCASHLIQGTYAPLYLDRALRLEEVRDWLGHKSIKTTERYAHLAPDGLLSRTQAKRHEPAPLALDFGEGSGLDRTREDSAVSDDLAKLAGILAVLEPPIRLERTTYGLRNGAHLQVIPGGYVEPSPLRVRIRALLEAYAEKRRPGDVELVHVLGEALAELDAAADREDQRRTS